MNLRDRLLQAPEERRHVEAMPAWDTEAEPGRKVELREFSARDRIWWRSEFWEADLDEDNLQRKDDKGNSLIRPRDFWNLALVMLCLFDPQTGERIFGREDVQTVANAPASLFDKYFAPLVDLYPKALEINGLAAGAVEEAANFTSPTPNTEASSTSPETTA